MILYLHMQYVLGTAAENAENNAALSPYYDQRAPYHRGVPDAEVKHLKFNETSTVPQIVARIIGAAVNERSIWRLMINCHGLPGEIHLGRGITTGNARDFRRLRAYMTPGGAGITAGCCYAASGLQVPGTARGCVLPASDASNGLTLLMELARHTGVKVEGAIDQQITWNLNGPVLTVLPDGTYSVRRGRTVEYIRSGAASYDDACPT